MTKTTEQILEAAGWTAEEFAARLRELGIRNSGTASAIIKTRYARKAK